MQYVEISREAAIEQGLKRYFTGLPCVRGHISERYTVNTRCVGCAERYKVPAKIIPSRQYGLPARALLFLSVPTPTAHEIHAAFRYIEAAGWHDAAITALRADPAVMAKYEEKLTPKEYFELEKRYRDAVAQQSIK